MVSRLRRFTSKLARFAVGRRASPSRRRQEISIPGRVYSDGPHGGESRPSGPDTTRAVRRPGRRWDGSRCLVTGASSGLGRAIAEHLVRAGARVVLTGRSTERLGAVARGLIAEGSDPDRIIAVPADLTVEGDRRRLFDDVGDHFTALDLVINNAGVGAAGRFHTHDPEVLRRVFEINVFAMAEVCREFLPLLVAGGGLGKRRDEAGHPGGLTGAVSRGGRLTIVDIRYVPYSAVCPLFRRVPLFRRGCASNTEKREVLTACCFLRSGFPDIAGRARGGDRDFLLRLPGLP